MSIQNKVDHKYINVDPLEHTYHESIIDTPERIEPQKKGTIALLCVDMQYLDAAPGHGVFEDAAKSGVPIEAQEYYFSTLKFSVFPNVRKLQDCFRNHNLEVIHIRIQSLTQDGRDRSPSHKRLDLLAAPGSKEAEFIEQVAPVGDEIIINKTASGVFTSTNLLFVLKNIEIESIFVTGVYTNECVSTTVRDGSDLGFFVTLIEDGCTTVTKNFQDFSLAILKDRYARVISTEKAIQEIEKLHQLKPTG